MTDVTASGPQYGDAVASAPVDDVPVPAKVGRPARINRQMIAEAAHEVGLDGLTLRAVADHLGVSIAALYHHVSSKDDLVRAAAEYTAGRVPLPEDRGQHWAVWLAEWAQYNHDVFATQPALLAEYLDGAIGRDVIGPSLERILGLLTRQGFTPLEADAAYGLVASTSIGLVLNEVRAAQAGGLAEESEEWPDDMPHLQALAADLATTPRPRFAERITTVLRGIAAERGEPWDEVAAALASG